MDVDLRRIPLLLKEGWLREAQTGGVAHNEMCGVPNHPVHSQQGGFAPFFLRSRPPLLQKDGNTASETYS
jgi:hypothetical protein